MSLPQPSPPPAVRWITRTLEEAGYETWTVGGAVRDVLMGRPAGDWDLTTRARPDDMRRLFRRTVPIGVDHGTVGVLARDGTMFEVTTFRRDVETDGRHAVVAFADRVEDDLARRDFTINAVAWHALTGRYLDPYGGREDMSAGRLRTVGEPRERFAEDYLRILRALRFAGRFGLEVDPATWDAMVAGVSSLPSLSAERVRDELLKVLDADPRPSTALGLYVRSGATAVLYPELERVRDAEAWGAALATVDHLPPGRPLLRLAALLTPLSRREAAQLLVRLRLSNADTDRVAHVAGAGPLPGCAASDAELRRWLSRTGPAHLPPVARLELATARATPAGDPGEVVGVWRRLRGVARARPPLDVGDLAIGGRDLIGLGLRPGPRFKEILRTLLDQVLEAPERNTPDVLLVEAQRLARGADDGHE